MPFPLPSLPDAETPIYIDEAAFVTIDVQGEFCDPNSPLANNNNVPQETVNLCEQIQSISCAFRKACVRNYHVLYYNNYGERDFFKLQPDKAAGDRIIIKNDDSAFDGSNIDAVLQGDKKKTLLVCGFNLSACVLETVVHARKAGYEVYVLTDLTKDTVPDEKYTNSSHAKMRAEGIHLIDSVTAFARLKVRVP